MKQFFDGVIAGGIILVVVVVLERLERLIFG